MGPRRDASSALPALPPLLSPSPIQSLWAGYGTLVRGRLPSGEPCVEKLVLPPSGSGVAHARRLRSYANEMWFYRDYAARLRGTGAEVAAVHGLEATEGRFRFVLEDLAVRFPGSREELDEREAKAVLSWLAAFHAAFVGNDGEGLWEQGTYWHLATRGDELAAIPNSHKELKSLAAKLDVRLRSDVPWRTLVHGDAKAENFLFSRDGSACAACDFQYAGRGLGVQDVAYVLASSVNAQLLAKKERDLLAFYHGRLVELARASDLEFAYPFERMMDDFEVALLDYARFLAGWGWWGNTRWIKSRTADIMKRRGAEIASWPEVALGPTASLASDPQLILEPADAPSEVVRQRIRKHPSFGAPLPLERYLAREEMLCALPFGAAARNWVLKAGGKWTSTCRTFVRPCAWAVQGDVHRGEVAVVGAVCTSAHLRGRGFAREMMRQLRERLRAEGPPLVASTLYSGIGRDFYAALGWASFPSKEAVLFLGNAPLPESPGLPAAEPLLEATLLESYLPADLSLLIADLARASLAGKRAFAVLPDLAAMRWLRARSLFYQAEIGAPGAREAEMQAGFAVGDPASGEPWSYVAVYADFPSSTLRVQRTRLAAGADGEGHAAALLLACAGEARRLGLGKVCAWDTGPMMDAAFRTQQMAGTRIGERAGNDNVSCLCWLDGGEEGTEWLANEYFGWA